MIHMSNIYYKHATFIAHIITDSDRGALPVRYASPDHYAIIAVPHLPVCAVLIGVALERVEIISQAAHR